jgi:hypothetical protein
MNTATSTQTIPATVGMRVRVESPGWYRHGQTGTIVKVNRKTIRVLVDGIGDTVVGSPIYFQEV